MIMIGASDAAGHEAKLAELRAALEHPSMTPRSEAEPLPTEPSEEELREIEDRMKMLGYM